MTDGNLVTCTREDGGISFKTGGGFAFAGGTFGARGTGGEKLAAEFHEQRLSARAVEFWLTVPAAPKARSIAGITVFEGRLQPAGAGWRAGHGELFKCDRYFDDYAYYTGGLFEPLPGVEGEFGLSEDAPFPGIVFSHPERGTVLMAVLSQERCKPMWRIKNRGGEIAFEAAEAFTGTTALPVTPGAEFRSERWVLLFSPGGLDDAVDAYFDLLRARMTFPGANSILREATVWGSWNYNRRPRGFADIDHDYVAANARALAELAAGKPAFAMIDDGWQRGRSAGSTHHDWFSSALEVFHPDGRPAHDSALFPQGMDGMAQAIRAAGVKPALWVTQRLNRESALAREHPDWLLQLADGLSFGRRSAFLDYSLPEVRDFIRGAWRTIFEKWGYQGLKLDFWSYPFEVPQVRFRDPACTGVQLRNMFLEDLRGFIPPGGYLLVCCACNSGNPFIGRFADAARMGRDIGAGDRFELQDAATILTAVAPFYRPDCLLGDADTIGWCPEVTPGANRLWATFAFLAGAVCEIGGDLANLSPEARGLLAQVVGRQGPRRRTPGCLDQGAIGNTPASRLVLETGSGVYEGHFNWRPQPRAVRLPAGARDIWTGREVGGRFKIPANDAVLLKR